MTELTWGGVPVSCSSSTHRYKSLGGFCIHVCKRCRSDAKFIEYTSGRGRRTKPEVIPFITRHTATILRRVDVPKSGPTALVQSYHSACIYYGKPYSNQHTWKNMNFSWFFEEISSQASPETLSVTRECCLGHFWWKIFSSNFQLLFWVIIFAWFHQKIRWFS